MPHDFKKHPELTNSQMQIYYFMSPHKQIVESFRAKVVKVTDGDTVRVKTDFRDFDFPIRLPNINAPESNEAKGLASALWLANKALGKSVEIIVNPFNRVGKFGRLIGDIFVNGELMSESSLRENQSRPFGEMKVGRIPTVEEMLK